MVGELSSDGLVVSVTLASVEFVAQAELGGQPVRLTGVGNGPIDAFVHALSDVDIDDGTEYAVVRNDEEQYSIWPVDRPLPLGWHEEGTRGPRNRCLDHIDEVWTDMRPRSARDRERAPEEA